MGDSKWEDGAVCYAYCNQFYSGEHYHELVSKANHGCSLEHALKANVFQLNEIRQGDYIPASELDTEQKYNNAVEVLGLFGFDGALDWESQESYNPSYFYIDKDTGELDSQRHYYEDDMLRKITYSQLMAIGKLKRAMIERDEVLIEGVENTSILKDTLEEAREDFEKAIDKVKPLQQDFSSEQATLDCKELDINVVFTGEGVYILDCINSVEYQLESVDEYNKVVSAIRLLQSKER